MSIDTLDPLVPGDDYPLEFTFTNEDGTPENQTGAALQVMVKANPDDADASALTNITVNASDPDASNGIIKATLPSSSTRAYPQDSVVYLQARRTLGGLKRTPLLVVLQTLNSVIDAT